MRISLLTVITSLAFLAARSSPAFAQPNITKDVLVLPLVTDAADQALGHDLYQGIIDGLRLLPGQKLIDPQTAVKLIGDQPPAKILGDRDQMAAFTKRSGVSFLIGGVVRRLEDGRFEVTTIFYSRDDQRVRELLNHVFDDEDAARDGARNIGERLSHPRNFSPVDTPLLYSLIVPGLGQLQMDAPLHALASAGLVAGAVFYGLTAPQPDQFRIDFNDFRTELTMEAGDYRYFIRHQEVSAEEFFSTLNEDISHNARADEERRVSEVRKSWAVRLFVASYLFNLVDTLWLIRREVDTRPFSIRLQAVPVAGGFTRQYYLGLQLRWIFR